MSKFLPANFDKTAPLLLIAGKGIYPIMTRKALLENGIPHKLAAFEGETSEELWNAFPDTDRVMMNVGQLGKLLKTAKNFELRCDYAFYLKCDLGVSFGLEAEIAWDYLPGRIECC